MKLTDKKKVAKRACGIAADAIAVIVSYYCLLLLLVVVIPRYFLFHQFWRFLHITQILNRALAVKIYFVSLESALKVINKDFSQPFYILLDSWNILTENSVRHLGLLRKHITLHHKWVFILIFKNVSSCNCARQKDSNILRMLILLLS